MLDVRVWCVPNHLLRGHHGRGVIANLEAQLRMHACASKAPLDMHASMHWRPSPTLHVATVVTRLLI